MAKPTLSWCTSWPFMVYRGKTGHTLNTNQPWIWAEPKLKFFIPVPLRIPAPFFANDTETLSVFKQFKHIKINPRIHCKTRHEINK